MLGNLVGTRGCLATLLVLASCAHNVPQDSNTGEDGKEKGAKPVTLENGEGRATGIVTYPGGDRVDWKLLELPDKQRTSGCPASRRGGTCGRSTGGRYADLEARAPAS